jgi:hypothetical protein
MFDTSAFKRKIERERERERERLLSLNTSALKRKSRLYIDG